MATDPSSSSLQAATAAWPEPVASHGGWLPRDVSALQASLEPAVGIFQLEAVVAHLVLEGPLDQRLGANQEDFADGFIFQFAQRHSVFLKEPDQMLAGNPPIL